jgi:hypothetical protein
VLWYTLVIPAFRKLRHDHREFQSSLGYIVRPCLKRRVRERREGGEERRKKGEKRGGEEKEGKREIQL